MNNDKKILVLKMVSLVVSLGAAGLAMYLSDAETTKMKDEITNEVMNRITTVLAENNEEVL